MHFCYKYLAFKTETVSSITNAGGFVWPRLHVGRRVLGRLVFTKLKFTGVRLRGPWREKCWQMLGGVPVRNMKLSFYEWKVWLVYSQIMIIKKKKVNLKKKKERKETNIVWFFFLFHAGGYFSFVYNSTVPPPFFFSLSYPFNSVQCNIIWH